MNKRRIQKSELDAVGAKLLKAGRLRGEEIDRIVSAPSLFNAVRARTAEGNEKRASRSGWLGWKPAAASTAAFVALIISFGYFEYLNKLETAGVTRSKDLPRVLKTDVDSIKRELKAVMAAPRRSDISRPAATKVFYRENVRPAKPKMLQAPKKNEGEFYALSFAGNVEDAMRGGHIVRVDMPRSALFALGVDLPLENDSKFIKTDLLVGTDGVPRAIRFVD